MTEWMLEPSNGRGDRRNDAWRALPTPPVDAWSDPRSYIAEPALIAAVNTSLLLGQPLLVTGAPGCGKTELANFLAYQLGLERKTEAFGEGGPAHEYAIRFDMKSDTKAKDLFYSIDLVERFHAAHASSDKASVDPLKFIRFQALGRALLYARPRDDLSARMDGWQAHPGEPKRSVVLLDEIDKAPRDVPNDLLTEIEGMRMFMPELNRDVKASVALRPIIVITSNSDKPLSEAFLRRCTYFHIEAPNRAQLERIMERRIGLSAAEPLLSGALDLFLKVRSQPHQKKPGTSELLAFVHALIGFGFTARNPLDQRVDWQAIGAASLLKTREDQLRAFPSLTAVV